jgi:hypothetical protein
VIAFASPAEGATFSGGVVQIQGQAAASADFDHFVVEYGLSSNPQGWGPVTGPNTNPVPQTASLGEFNLDSVANGVVTFRIVVFNKNGGSAEARVRINVDHPEPPTPTRRPTATATEIPSATPVPNDTATLAPSETAPPTATEVPSATSAPSDTPTTELPTDIPTDTPAPTST